jgi:hypothetical protein
VSPRPEIGHVESTPCGDACTAEWCHCDCRAADCLPLSMCSRCRCPMDLCACGHQALSQGEELDENGIPYL